MQTNDCKGVNESRPNKMLWKDVDIFLEGPKEKKKSHSLWPCCFQEYMQFPFLEKDLEDRNTKAVPAACCMRGFSLLSNTTVNIFMEVKVPPHHSAIHASQQYMDQRGGFY